MREFLLGVLYLLIYYLFCASSALLLRLKTKIEDEVFRKLLHCILLGSMLVWVAVIPTWWQAALFSLFFAIAIYPVLYLAERIKGYSKTLTERTPGELKSSLLVVFFMFAVVIAVCWGWFEDKYLVLASIYAWGVGDAFAALIGKRYGKHKIHGKFLNGKKSWEGTATMFLCAFASVGIILLCRGGLAPLGYLVIPLVVAAVSAAAELYSRNGYDTIICPLFAMAALLPLTYLFGGML
jgi:dolichol kinase